MNAREETIEEFYVLIDTWWNVNTHFAGADFWNFLF